MKKPKSMRFVVGSALLVGAPWITGCPEGLGPTSNPVHVEPPPPNPVAVEPTGVGVPLPTTTADTMTPMPTANPVAHPEPPTNPAVVEAPPPVEELPRPIGVNTRPRHDPPPPE